MYKLKIELMSDLCTADGDGYSTVVDTDIVTDKFGIPYIPARRIKGCLRESAVYINAKHTDEIFGISGNTSSGSLVIGDAVIESHGELINELQKHNISSQQSVTELFTRTTASTAITEEGSAKENSLRFIRVIDHNPVWDNKRNMTFYSDITADEKYIPEISRICKALRHIGYKRTRGLGAVKCSLIRSDSKENIDFAIPENMNPDKEYILEYAIRLDENMMRTGNSYNKTDDYISGQAVIGMLAGEYLKSNPADSKFDSLFLSGKAKFSNLYITDSNLSEYIPAPVTLGKIKGGDGKIIDISDHSKVKDKIAKPLKNGYISSNMEHRTVNTEIIYHNAVNSNSGSLYTQLCLQKGQSFRGSITADGKSMSVIAGLLRNADISFGRSRTAQYSKCTLISARITPEKPVKIHAVKGDTLLYVFDSDAVISDEYGNISPSFESALKALDVSGEISPASALKYKTIKGFMSVMRLPKAHIRAVSAGSVIAVKCDKNMDVDSVLYIGEKQNEGFGKIRVLKRNRISEGFRKPLEVKNEVSAETSGKICSILDRLESQEEMRIEAIEFARSYKRIFIEKWNPSFIGRIILMTEESSDRINLNERIKSIKSKNKQISANDLLKHSECDHYKNWNDQKEYILLILQLARYMVKQGKEQ